MKLDYCYYFFCFFAYKTFPSSYEGDNLLKLIFRPYVSFQKCTETYVALKLLVENMDLVKNCVFSDLFAEQIDERWKYCKIWKFSMSGVSSKLPIRFPKQQKFFNW